MSRYLACWQSFGISLAIGVIACAAGPFGCSDSVQPPLEPQGFAGQGVQAAAGVTAPPPTSGAAGSTQLAGVAGRTGGVAGGSSPVASAGFGGVGLGAAGSGVPIAGGGFAGDGTAGVGATAGAVGAAGGGGLAGSDAAGSDAAGSNAAGNGAAGSEAAGSGAAGVGGAASPTAGAGGSAGGAAREDLGEGDGNDVVLIGDSWMSNTLALLGLNTGGGISPALIDVSMKRYTNYAVQGVLLLEDSGFGPKIPTQWESAKAKKPKTVIMTAGGNDVIQGSSTLQRSCSAGTDECKQKLLVIGQALNTLWTQMAADGVLDIVHIRYTDTTGTLAESFQGDKGFPEPEICSSGKVRCHAVWTTDIVPASALVDGIHPNAATNRKIAMRVLDYLKEHGIRR